MDTGDNGVKRNVTPIFLLKTKSNPNDGYEERFSSPRRDSLQFEPIFVPVLEHTFLDEGLGLVKELLQERSIGKSPDSSYGGLIFTSQRAVEAFAKVMEEGKGTDSWPHLQNIPVYTVGPATSRALRAIPQTPPLNVFGAETGNGSELALYILDHYGEWYQDRKIKPPLLFIVGEQRRDIIPKTLMDPSLSDNRQIMVKELVVYGTRVMESFKDDFTRALTVTKDREVRWVVVFSPSGCRTMLEVLNLLNKDTGKVNLSADMKEHGNEKARPFIATIGPTTRDYLINTFGLEPDVCADKPSPEGIEEVIIRFLSQNS